MLFKIVKISEQFGGIDASLGYISACSSEVKDTQLFIENIKNSAVIKIHGLSSEIVKIEKDYNCPIYYGYNQRFHAIIKISGITYRQPSIVQYTMAQSDIINNAFLIFNYQTIKQY